MNFEQAFYLFILPIAIAVGGLGVAVFNDYWNRRNDKQRHLH